MIKRLVRVFRSFKRPRSWDEQYRNGEWELLRSPLENERFEVVSSLIRRYLKNGSLLEIGCGEGILQQRMDQSCYSVYTGLDISSVAIQRAARSADSRSTYLVKDMEEYIPDRVYDVILFNESIYYAKWPVKLFERYAAYLSPAGVMILSIYETDENRRVIFSIEQKYQHAMHVTSENERGRWICRVYAKADIR